MQGEKSIKLVRCLCWKNVKNGFELLSVILDNRCIKFISKYDVCVMCHGLNLWCLTIVCFLIFLSFLCCLFIICSFITTVWRNKDFRSIQTRRRYKTRAKWRRLCCRRPPVTVVYQRPYLHWNASHVFSPSSHCLLWHTINERVPIQYSLSVLCILCKITAQFIQTL